MAWDLDQRCHYCWRAMIIRIANREHNVRSADADAHKVECHNSCDTETEQLLVVVSVTLFKIGGIPWSKPRNVFPARRNAICKFRENRILPDSCSTPGALNASLSRKHINYQIARNYFLQ